MNVIEPLSFVVVRPALFYPSLFESELLCLVALLCFALLFVALRCLVLYCFAIFVWALPCVCLCRFVLRPIVSLCVPLLVLPILYVDFIVSLSLSFVCNVLYFCTIQIN